MTTDTTEKGLERLICIAMAGHACEPAQGGAVAERPANYGVGWIGGDPQDYDREYCIDLAQLSAFLHDTQPVAAEPLDLGQGSPTPATSHSRPRQRIGRWRIFGRPIPEGDKVRHVPYHSYTMKQATRKGS